MRVSCHGRLVRACSHLHAKPIRFTEGCAGGGVGRCFSLDACGNQSIGVGDVTDHYEDADAVALLRVLAV